MHERTRWRQRSVAALAYIAAVLVQDHCDDLASRVALKRQLRVA
jgi:hypothetical protein